ncbi:uncharacterized protein J3R85_013321 [Psidium guajava]|nr:uncharacterized protein J3R85_013321 [Psidium guajava]
MKRQLQEMEQPLIMMGKIPAEEAIEEADEVEAEEPPRGRN